jgi:hypothetical protein
MKRLKIIGLGTIIFIGGVVVGFKGHQKLLTLIIRDEEYFRKILVEQLSKNIINFLYGKEGDNREN